MQSFFKKVNVMMVFLLVIMMIPYQTTSYAAANDYVSVTKVVDPTVITTEQEAEVKLSIKGTPPVNVVMPNDVILIIDKSGSMSPDYKPNNGEDKMTAAKNAAKGFIDLMDMTKHRVGVIDFSSANMTKLLPLTTDKDKVKNYIGSIEANGATATGNAIDMAIKELENHRPEAQPVIVIMTDGDATEPQGTAYEYALEKAQAAKDAGIVFYTIALLQPKENPETSGPNKLLKEMATTSAHHHFVLGSVGLSEIYAAIVKEIGMASAYNVQVTDIVSPEFEIVPGSYDSNIPKPTVAGNSLTWNFQELKNSDLSFTYKIKPKDPNKAGTFQASTTASIITYKDYAGAARQKAIPSVAVQVKLSAPVVTSIEQNFGKPEGGETVTIKGDNFRPGAAVTFGSGTATNIKVISKNEITATVPAGTVGTTVTVTVKNTDNQMATIPYSYKAAPVVTSIKPNNGPLAGGTSVLIEGNYFSNAIEVKFGDKVAPIKRYTNTKLIEVNSPATTNSGPVDVVLTNPDGTTVTVPGGFTYNAPVVVKLTVTSVSPNIGELAGGDAVYFDGTKFTTETKVFFGDAEAKILTFYSDKRFNVLTPTGKTPGAVEVKLVNPDGETVIIPAGFTYKPAPVKPAPTLTSITPDSGLITGGTSVSIMGSGFLEGVKVYFGTNEAAIAKLNSGSQITVTSPAVAAEGPVNVKVVNPDGQEVMKENGFNYLPIPPIVPAITSISPTSGPFVGGTVVYINGKDFDKGMKVYFGDKEVAIGMYYGSTRIQVTAPPATVAGAVNVRVVNPDGREGNVAAGYTYEAPIVPKAPSIKAISPDNGPLAGKTSVYIDGADFVKGLKVYFGSQEATVISFYNSGRLLVMSPTATVAGPVDVEIVNPDGLSAKASAGFTYNAPPAPKAPSITAISPNNGPIAGSTNVYIDGADFVNGLKVYFGNNEATILSFYNSTRILVRTPSSPTEGIVDVKIINPDNLSVVAAGGFTYFKPAPLPVTITTVTPDRGILAGGGTIDISGTNFQGQAKVQFGSQLVPIDYYYGSGKIRVKVPASATPGSVDITITNPDGGTATAVQAYTYEIAIPAITAITPNHGPMSGGTAVYIDGKNFDRDLVLTVNGKQVAVTTYYNSGRILFITQSSTISGSVSIVITNPSTGEKATGTFTYDAPPPVPAPAITRITPNSGPLAGRTVVYIDGSNFVNGLKVYFNGVEAQMFSFYGATRLGIFSPAASAAGIVDVKIVNPDGQVTNSVQFEYK
ncbi:IPT/TIG domain-containing protein [Paenibacillus guangzhouensis]|uniref:IPT/TIG domain-containing protein n=1 Tax=Paenibacillus guangzhouensis TaxID=1473112 RepID=UPI001266EDD6|nr:IPT/TIG domain-containing protein [Paenibacillus guangzhouensis]